MESEAPEDAWAQLRARIAVETRERFRRGEAVVGGRWWEIDPAWNYCQASRVLVDESERAGTFGPLALPTIYLQRHATELTLKALTRAAHEALEAMGTPLTPPDFDFNHRLDTWLDRLTTALNAVGLPTPGSATAVVESLRAVGDGDGQSWRYGRVKQKGAHKATPAFPSELPLPVRELQEKVDAFVKDAYETSVGDGLFWDLGAIALNPSVLPNWKPKPSVGPRRPARWWKSRKD